MSQPDAVKRLCLFAHFDRDNIVDEYVLFYLKDLRKVADRIVFISTARLHPETITALKTICDSVILRKNEGYDFASWQAALKSETLKDFDELILCNDSVYGPLFPLEKIFSEMRERDCDFWGMTSSHDIAYHLQSYFLVFRKTVLVSDVFQHFWESMKISQSKARVISLCEIGLSQILLNAGFKFSTFTRHRFSLLYTILYRLRSYLVRTGGRIGYYARILLFGSNQWQKKYIMQNIRTRIIRYATNLFSQTRTFVYGGFSTIREMIRHPREQMRGLFLRFERRMKSTNVTHYFWKQLVLDYGMPFIKVELLRDNPASVNTNDYAKVVSMVSNYKTTLIRSHLSRVKNVSRKKR